MEVYLRKAERIGRPRKIIQWEFTRKTMREEKTAKKKPTEYSVE